MTVIWRYKYLRLWGATCWSEWHFGLGFGWLWGYKKLLNWRVCFDFGPFGLELERMSK